MSSLRSAILLGLLCMSGPASAQAPQWWKLPGFQSGRLAGRFDFQKVGPCYAGSLLFFVGPTSGGTGPDRMERLYALDPRHWSRPQMVLKSDRPISVKARLDARTVLISCHAPYDLYLLDLSSGRWRPLLNMPNLDLLKANSQGIYFFVTLNRGNLGYQIEGEDHPRVVSEPAPQRRLLFVEARAMGKPVRVFERAVSEVVLETDQAFLVTTPQPQRQLWWVAKDRRSHRCLMTLPEDWLAGELTAYLSPDGLRLALGVAHSNGFFDRRDLLIVDSQTGEVTQRVKDIPVRVSMASSLSPKLMACWLDNQHVRWSQTEWTQEKDRRFQPGFIDEGYFCWFDLDLSTGISQDRGRYATIGLRHAQPSPVLERPERTRLRQGCFETAGYDVFLPGHPEAILGLSKRNLSPEGDYGFSSGDKGPFADEAPLWLWDGHSATRRRVFEGWTYWRGWDETSW